MGSADALFSPKASLARDRFCASRWMHPGSDSAGRIRTWVGRDREDEINMHASGPGMRPLFPEADQEVPQNDPFLDTLFFGCFGNTPFLGHTIFWSRTVHRIVRTEHLQNGGIRCMKKTYPSGRIRKCETLQVQSQDVCRRSTME